MVIVFSVVMLLANSIFLCIIMFMVENGKFGILSVFLQVDMHTCESCQQFCISASHCLHYYQCFIMFILAPLLPMLHIAFIVIITTNGYHYNCYLYILLICFHEFLNFSLLKSDEGTSAEMNPCSSTTSATVGGPIQDTLSKY